MSRRTRGLSAADIALWRAVAETISHRMPSARMPSLPAAAPLAPGAPGLRAGDVRLGARAETTAQAPRPSAPGWSPPPQRATSGPGLVDRALRKRLAAGRQSVDASLDLHGMGQSEAHARLHAFLAQAQREGARVALVVTGTGARDRGRTAAETGVLRRLVPLWLTQARLAPLIVGFGEAARDHGGAGALYVHLRSRDRHKPF